jgi:pentatricopeptide repeat protein
MLNKLIVSPSACSSHLSWRQALEVGTWMDAADPPVGKNVVTYSALISACSKGRQWPRARAVQEEMQQRGVAMNDVTYATLIQAAGDAGEVRERGRNEPTRGSQHGRANGC